jgi:hypothetical protein
MPTRKQRRRRAKDRRHEYEYVYVDDQGNEVEVDEDDQAPAKPARQSSKPGGKPGARGRSADRGKPQRGGAARKVDPPSWNRVLRRATIFAPLMLIVIYLLKPKNSSPAAIFVQLAVLLLLFLPFSYFMDSMMYRTYRKRIGDPLPPRERKPREPREK